MNNEQMEIVVNNNGNNKLIAVLWYNKNFCMKKLSVLMNLITQTEFNVMNMSVL